ncbi:MAG: MmcQ/YjbR family DNA-binding protein [Alphaproteobacteria bacterium]|nr:MmcQ/YjbR family DNA-binding protein [Alphaproteobacteria bacterium]
MALTKAQVNKIVLSFPGANESTSYGYPSFKIEKKFFTRLRAEDNSLVLTVSSMDERDMLLQAEPELFHITPHYQNYPTVLARIECLDAKILRGMLERRWKQIASKRLQKESSWR